MSIIKFEDLSNSDLIIDAIYEGGTFKNTKDDPINKLIPVGNMGGFRYNGKIDKLNFLVLYTDGSDLDWPDTINLETGIFTYYGDNRKPGKNKVETKKSGNLILENLFKSLYDKINPRSLIPPIFIFQKYPTKKSSRSVMFRGLCVPGNPAYSQTEDLVSVWKSKDSKRFENYKAVFSILNCSKIKRDYINEILSGVEQKNIPKEFQAFKERGSYNLLQSERISEIRNDDEQLPISSSHIDMLSTIFTYFKAKEGGVYIFEKFAADIFKMSNKNVLIDEITQGSVDGGRDAIGRYKIGPETDPIFVHFALEAKLYNPGFEGNRNIVGVKETSRLISRIKNREFGVMVTTSVIGKQSYSEVREDKHPIIFITGKDIIDILISKGFNSVGLLKNLLSSY
jgi:hypothetical protein